MPPALSTGALFGRSSVRSLFLLAKRLQHSERPINISCCSSETKPALVSHKIFSGGAIGRSASSPFRMHHSVSSTLKWPRQSRYGVSNVPWHDAQRWQSGGVRCMSAGSPEHVVVEEDQVRPSVQLPPPFYIAQWLAFDMHSAFVQFLDMHSRSNYSLFSIQVDIENLCLYFIEGPCSSLG
jgi:hypothetical protein